MSCNLLCGPFEVLSSVAVLEMFSVVFGVMVAEESFRLSSIAGLHLTKKFFSSTDGLEVTVILLAGEPNAAMKIAIARIPGLTHRSTEYQ